MNLYQWAIKWNVPHDALADLMQQVGIAGTVPPHDTVGKSEAAVQNLVRAEAASKGVILHRNNVGAMQDADGRVVRFGLANDSKAVNQRLKSSDLIGIRPGGQYIAREIKPSDWVYTGTPWEQAQLRFLTLIMTMGGDAAFATGTGTI